MARLDQDKWGYRRIVEDIQHHIAAGRLKRPPPRSRTCPQCGEPLAAVALKPGDKLMSRSELADWYAPVSESTVAKALLVLQEAGETFGEHGVGVYVRAALGEPEQGEAPAT